jgi:hypothetical protein
MACYANPDPLFLPAMRIVTNITRSNPAVVTTSFAHDYLTGEILRLIVPSIFGMWQANQQQGVIEVIDSTSFYIALDTTNYDTFAAPSPMPEKYTCAQVCPVGELNEMLTAAEHNVLG